MNRLFAAPILILLLNIVTPANADLVYEFVNHVGDQNGQTITGTITTVDTAVNDGYLRSNEVVSWQWSVSGPNASSVTNTSANATISIQGDVLINSNQISLPEPNIMSEETYSIELGNNSGGRVSWYREDQFGIPYEFYQGANAWSTTSPTMSNTNPWQVATITAVPEPNSLWLAASLILGAFTVSRRRTTGIS